MSVRLTSAPSPTRCVRQVESEPSSHSCSKRAHVAQSGNAQITTASESLVIATRKAPITRAPNASTAGTPISWSASRKPCAAPTGSDTSSCA